MSWNTDFPDVAPCDRNNCRCGSDQNCMYYNNPGVGHAHYNVTAVQGEGAPTSPDYSCANKAMDYYNHHNMYDDHAGMLPPGLAPENQGPRPVHYGVHPGCGNRDMCNSTYTPDVEVIPCAGNEDYYLVEKMSHPFQRQVMGLPAWFWLAVLAVLGFWLVKDKKLKFDLKDHNNRRIEYFESVPPILGELGKALGSSEGNQAPISLPKIELPNTVSEPLVPTQSFNIPIDVPLSIPMSVPLEVPISAPKSVSLNIPLQVPKPTSDCTRHHQHVVDHHQHVDHHPIVENCESLPNWSNQEAARYVGKMVERYGRPSSVDSSRGGSVVWRSELLGNCCLSRVEVRDESVFQCVPTNHYAFVYAYVKYAVPASRMMDVIQLSPSIGYDRLKQILWARGGNIDAAIATLALAVQVGQRHVSVGYAKTNNLLGHYLTASQDPNQAYELYNLLCANLHHQSPQPKPQSCGSGGCGATQSESIIYY